MENQPQVNMLLSKNALVSAESRMTPSAMLNHVKVKTKARVVTENFKIMQMLNHKNQIIEQ